MPRYRVDEIIVVKLVTDVQNYLDAMPADDRLISTIFDPIENKVTVIVETQELVVNDCTDRPTSDVTTETSIN